ncbi:MAG: hypothetical protein ACLVJ6_13825 [Merdibacter sp.]
MGSQRVFVNASRSDRRWRQGDAGLDDLKLSRISADGCAIPCRRRRSRFDVTDGDSMPVQPLQLWSSICSSSSQLRPLDDDPPAVSADCKPFSESRANSAARS